MVMTATMTPRGGRTLEIETILATRNRGPAFPDYQTEGFYDEMFDDRAGRGPRPNCWPGG